MTHSVKIVLTRNVKYDITFIDTKRVMQKEVIKLDRLAVAKRLIELRSSKSQEEVANAVGISKSALSMYENAERIPRDEIKIRLAKYYGKTVQYIFFNKNDT